MSSGSTNEQTVSVVRKRVPLAPIDVPKSSDVLADTLRERILAGDYPEDTALPSERDLVSHAQISRTSVREALRILEAQGFVRIKTGRAGGAFVRLPGEESVASTVSMFIKGRRIRMDSLLETREAVEPSMFAAYWDAEQHLMRVARQWTILRMNFYAESFAQFVPMSLGSGRGPG